MRLLAPTLACLLVLTLPAVAVSQQWAPRAPEKPVTNIVPPPADPDVVRQGGDTFADAVPVTLPYSGSGTIVGYNDDYEESCP